MYTLKYKIRFAAFFLGMLLLSNTLIAQSVAYIIDKSGNKIEGKIKNIGKKSIFKYVNFKKTGGSRYTKYYPEDLKLFRAENKEYISSLVTVNPRKTVTIGEGLPKETKSVLVFLQKLYEVNSKSLYHTRVLGTAYYFIRKDGTLEVLQHMKYKINNENGVYSGELKKYIGQLKLYLNDCSSLQPSIDRVLYTKASLSRLFRAYAKCVGVMMPPEKKKVYKRKLGLLLGMAFTKLNFYGGDSRVDFLTNTKFRRAFTINTGFIFQHRSQKNYTFVHELAYLYYKARGGYLKIISLTEIEKSYLKLNNLVKCRIKNGDIYSTFGVSTGFRLTSKSTNTSLENPPKGGLIGVFPKSRLLEIGPMLGLGTDSKFGSLEFRLELANGPSQIPKSSAFRLYFNYSIYF